MHHNWQKMVQLGVPLASLYKDFDVPSSITPITYERNGKERVLAKRIQCEMYEELWDFKPSKDVAPIFCISSPIHDRPSVRVGVNLMSHFLDNKYQAAWHTMYGGYNQNTIKRYKTDVLFITNVVRSSTNHKIELLRDLLYLNNDCLRIIITAGWHGLDLSDQSQIGVHGLIHLGKFKK